MKKAIRVVLGIVLVLVIVVVAAPFAAPWFIDLNSYKPEIADAVRDATGRELKIDGDIEYSLLPNLEFSASGITLSNAPDAANPDMLSVAKVSGKIAVFPLLGRNVEIERLVVETPQAFLEVDQAGRPNWAFETAKPGPKPGKDRKAKAAKDGKSEKTAKAEDQEDEDSIDLPINGLHLGDVRIDKGLVSYRDATTGQSIEVTDIDVTLALADLDSIFQATGRLTLNGEPVSLDLSLDTPGGLLAGEPALAKAGLGSKPVSAAYDGSLLRLPVPGLDGTFELDVPSVGGLAAWLGRPLDEAQPDPGPLKITAAFTGDGAKVALKEARIEGEELQATASGSFDANGEVTKIALKVESGLLNIDRYLPPPGKPMARPAAGGKPEGAAKRRPARERGDALAAIPSEPIDLTPLRQTEADIAIDIGGIKAVGFEIGSIAIAVALKDGVLNENTEVQLYGGTVKRQSKLDASGEALTLETNVDVSKVDVGALARAASGPGGDGAPVAGVASGSLAAKTAGVSPRALVENLTASLAIDLGGVDVKDAPAGAISELKANLELPGLASPPNLTASVVYNKERVGLEATLDPIDKILAGEAFAAKAAVSSALVKAGYDGRVLQEPVPGLDGVFDLDIPSVGKLAAWLGQPLDPAQPDPGPLQVRAAFAGDGAKVALEEATIKGTALEAKASGSYDGSGEIAKIVLDLESGVLDIDRYLPAPPKKQAKAKTDAKAETPKPAKKQVPAGGNPLAAIPDEPIDFSGLRQAEADLRIAVGGIKAAGFTLGKTAFTSQLKDGVLDADLSEMRLYGGNVKGTVRLDGSGDALAVKTDLNLAGINVGKLAAAATGEKPAVTGVASGTLNAATKGANPRALAESLSAKVALKLDGAEVADKSAGTISALDVKLDLPGLDSPSQLDGSVVYNGEKVDLGATLDPINKILAGATFAAKLAVKSPLANVRYDGKVQQQPVAGLDGTLDLDTSSVGKLAAWLGQPLGKQQPDPGPLKVHAALAADGQKMALKEATLEGKALKAKATGSYDGTKAVPYIQANLNLMEADLNAYLPPREAGEAAPQKQEKAKKTEKKSQTGQQKKQAKKKQGAGGATAWSAKPIDFSGLSKANADVEVRLGKVRYGELTAKKGLLTVKLAAGVLDTVLKELTLARGSITGSAKVDASKPKAAVTYKASVDGVEALPLLKTFAGSDRLSGTMHLKTKGSTRGRSEKELVGSLNGDGNFKFLDGAVHGFNLAKTLRNAGSLGLGAASSEKTDFAELSGTFTITKGILENRDMKLLAPLVRVGGAGKVPMPPKTVDYVAEAKLVGSLEGQGGQEALKGLTIPVHVTGPWHDVQYEIDWKSVFTAAALDPSRLELLPKNLQDTAKGLGVALPALGAGAAGAGIGGVLESVTGGGKSKSGKKDGKKSGGVLGTLEELANPTSKSKPAKAETKTTKKAKAEKKDGKAKKDKNKKKKKDGKVDPLKELQNILQN